MSSLIVSNENRVPEAKTLQHAVKLAILEDKPIILDYSNPRINFV